MNILMQDSTCIYKPGTLANPNPANQLWCDLNCVGEKTKDTMNCAKYCDCCSAYTEDTCFGTAGMCIWENDTCSMNCSVLSGDSCEWFPNKCTWEDNKCIWKNSKS